MKSISSNVLPPVYRAHRVSISQIYQVQEVTYLWAHKERKYDGTNAGKQLPDPDLPANVRNGDASCKYGNEGEQPFAKGIGGIAAMAILEWCNLQGISKLLL
jgi:hypothetical protein